MLVADFNVKELINGFDWNFEQSKPDALHSIHSYPAKFIPDIPRTLIQKLPIPKNTVVLDPFCGSGVTLLEAQKAGLESVGIDLNPIACLLSQVKTMPLDPSFEQIAAIVLRVSRTTTRKALVPDIPNVDHWFKKDIQEALAILLKEIDKITDPNILNALRFCFSSIVVKVSNQESDTRYAAIGKPWVREDVFNLFEQSAARLQKAKSTFSSQISSTVLNMNSLELSNNDLSKKVGLVITSPPYPNAYEYWLYHKYRMWWLGYDPIAVKDQEIGARAHYFKKNHQTIDDFIDQMKELFARLWLVTADRAFVCFVIGQSKIHGKIIPNEQLIADIGKEKGFTHVTTTQRTINPGRKSFNLSHARIKEEFLVILQK